MFSFSADLLGSNPSELATTVFRDWLAGLTEKNKTFIRKLTPDDRQTDLDDTLTEADIGLLAQLVANCQVHDMDSIFLYNIVHKFSPKEWKYEFLLLEMEQHFLVALTTEERTQWGEILRKLSDEMLSTLRKQLKTTGEPSTCSLDKEKLEKILKLLEKVHIYSGVQQSLNQLPLENWYLELRSQFWRSKLTQGKKMQLNDDQKKEAISMLMELENREGEAICGEKLQDLIKELSSSPSRATIRWPDMSKLLQQHLEPMEQLTENELKIAAKENGKVANIIGKMIQNEDIDKHYSRGGTAFIDLMKSIQEKMTKPFDYCVFKTPLDLTNDSSLLSFLDTYETAIKRIMLKHKFKFTSLRNTQKVAILTLLTSGRTSALAQVSTGEGKSLIVAAVAIGRALSGQDVDIITSNDVLARRDSELKLNQGGLCEIYEAFNIKVGNNSSENAEERAAAYKCPVVYGQMSSFQRDYLLDTFYGREIRGNRQLSCVIIDEVDCMLLDRGNNVLYLSHDIPGMEMLESLYVFIWRKIKTPKDPLGPIKSAILYDLFGEIKKDDLFQAIQAPLIGQQLDDLWNYLTGIGMINNEGSLLIKATDVKKEMFDYSTISGLNRPLFIFFNTIPDSQMTIKKDDLARIQQKQFEDVWAHLIRKNIIDQRGRLLIEDAKYITGKLVTFHANGKLTSKIARKIVFFLRQVARRRRHIRIPYHLLSFVDRHLDTWLNNALVALKLKLNVDYAHDKTDTSSSIVDENTKKNGQRSNKRPPTMSVGTSRPNNKSKTGTISNKDTSISSNKSNQINSKDREVPSSVIIIDPDTGTDQTSAQWGESLHQFLQLKEGCKITLQSLKSVFVSSVSYIKLYERLAGVTGTLGSKPERHFLRNTYNCDFFIIPTAFPKRFIMKPARIIKTSKEWLDEIIKETRHTVLSQPRQDPVRSAVVFCQSISQVEDIYKKLTDHFKSEVAGKKIIINKYTRDYEKFPFESKELGVGHIIVATNLAGRGTDIKIDSNLRKNGGLHICLTYLPDNVRIEEQAFGRAGRKGEPGSGILILCDAGDKNRPSRTIYEMKYERNQQEMLRISQLTQDFAGNISKQEKCFHHFFQYFKYLKQQLVKGKFDQEEIGAVCKSALDQWALWLDSVSDSFESQSLEQLLKRLKTFIDSLQPPVSTANVDDISWMSWLLPGRLIVMAKHLASRKERNLAKANAILTKLIDSRDKILYPAAPYYLAFVILKEGRLWEDDGASTHIKRRFLLLLRMAETLLKEHIQTQISFLGPSGKPKTAYQEQKENLINLLEHYVHSVQSLMGAHCSVAGLVQAGIDASTANNLFEQLAADCLVTCQVSHVDTIPGGRDATLREVAYKNAVSQNSLTEYLKIPSWKFRFNEFAMRERLFHIKMSNETYTVMTHCWSRDEFWLHLVENGALYDATDNAVVPEAEYKAQHESNRIKMDPRGLKGYVMSNKLYSKPEDLKKEKKMMLTKNYLKEKFPPAEYDRRELTFESCRFARLEPTKLALLNFGQLIGPADLKLANIDEKDRHGIWNELIRQKIIDQDGQLSSQYNDTQRFRYADCPAYEEPVKKLIDATFAAEKVRRRLLDKRDPERFYAAIADLPLQSDRDLLWDDLLATHIISGARVTADRNVDFKDEIINIVSGKEYGCVTGYSYTQKKFLRRITNQNQKNLLNCLLPYLVGRRALYATMETPAASLRFLKDAVLEWEDLEEVIDRRFGNSFLTEENLQLLGLLGFDHTIKLEEEKWSKKTIIRAIAIIFLGALQLAASVILFHLQITPWVAIGLIKAGVEDVILATKTLWTGQQITWANYRQHKRNQAIKLLRQFVVRGAGNTDSEIQIEDLAAESWKDQLDQTNVQIGQVMSRNVVAENIAMRITRNHDGTRVWRIVHRHFQESKIPNDHHKLPDHLQAGYKLLKKTKDPQLFAVLIRNNRVPMDQFSADALGCALSAHFKRKVAIQIEDSQQVFDRDTTANADVQIVKVERRGGVHGCCLFEYVAPQFVHDELTTDELRNSLASMIETDQPVAEAIRQNWLNRGLRISLFGGQVTSTSKRIRETDFSIGGIPTIKKRRQEPFQSDYNFIHSAIKDERIRNIPINEYPIMTIANIYKGGDASNSYVDVSVDNNVTESDCFQLFRHIQRGYLERGQYRNAIWNTVETNWLAVAKRSQRDVELYQKDVEIIKDHFKQYSNDDAQIKIIDQQEVNKLETILDNKVKWELTANKDEGKQGSSFSRWF